MDFDTTNTIVDTLAPLMKYKAKIEVVINHFDLEDSIDIEKSVNVKPLHVSVNLKAYEAHITKVIQKLINESPILQKLFIGQPLSSEDIEALKNDLLKEEIQTEQLSELFTCKSHDLVEIFTNILHKKEYKLPMLLNKFIETHTLNTTQIEFIQAIKHFIEEKRGQIQRKDFTENPFTKFHKLGIQGIFHGSMMNELVEIIDDKGTAI